MPPEVTALNIGVGPCRKYTCGDMVDAMARIAPSQPNEAIVRIASRSPVPQMVKKNIYLDLSNVFGLDTKLFLKVKLIRKEDWAKKGVVRHAPFSHHKIL